MSTPPNFYSPSSTLNFNRNDTTTPLPGSAHHSFTSPNGETFDFEAFTEAVTQAVTASVTRTVKELMQNDVAVQLTKAMELQKKKSDKLANTKEEELKKLRSELDEQKEKVVELEYENEDLRLQNADLKDCAKMLMGVARKLNDMGL
jgi:acyl-CoA reductase-like NAD-dependent aldehyde dehydrogenase